MYIMNEITFSKSCEFHFNQYYINGTTRLHISYKVNYTLHTLKHTIYINKYTTTYINHIDYP